MLYRTECGAVLVTHYGHGADNKFSVVVVICMRAVIYCIHSSLINQKSNAIKRASLATYINVQNRPQYTM